MSATLSDWNRIDHLMLPASVRMRNGDEFAATVRRGRKCGSKTVLLHAWRPADPDPDAGNPQIGFVVSKAVGMAVVRNRTKRRLRHLVRCQVGDSWSELPRDLRVVVRALPAAARHPERLAGDLQHVWSQVADRGWRGLAARRYRQPASTTGCGGPA